jgi:ComF family protein
MFKVLQNSLFSLIYPQECRVCSGHVENVEDGVACAQCWSDTRIFAGDQMLCAKCGAYFNDPAVKIDVRCHKCDDHHYDKAAAAGVYEKALAASVINLKSVPKLPRTVASVFVNAFLNSGFGATTLIVPIPLSRRRQMERGFNQADVLGKVLADATGIKLDGFSLIRKVHSPMHRIAMDEKARELTVRNSFDVTRPKLVAGQNILLVDDVLTSGATSSYCAKVLKKNGAGVVNVLTLARAVSD